MPAQTYDVKVAANGRLVLPASVRAALGLHGESRITLTVDDEGVSLHPMAHHILKAQALYRQHVTSGKSVDDFLKARRLEESGRESALSGEDHKG